VKVKARDLTAVLKAAESFFYQGVADDVGEAVAKAKDWVEKRRLEEKLERL